MKSLILILVGCFGLPWTLAQLSDLNKPEIYSLKIVSDIKYRFATTLVTSRVKNPADTLRETIFDITLPNEAFITNLTLEIDGKIVVGEIKRKEEAKRQYEAAQQRGESAGYIGTQHRETNKFNLAVSVAPMGKVTFNLTYQELLQRKNGVYEQVVYIDPGQPVAEMEITVNILESRNITELNIPPLRNDVGDDLMDIDSIMVTSRPTPKSAYIYFAPSVEQQLLQSTNGLAGKFAVQYDVERSMDAGDILMVNGYFVHFFAPDGLDAMPNDVLFILDVSGSMSGTKMKQMKEAMLQILDVMDEGDRINIMTFSSSINLWRSNMSNVDDEDDLEEAKEYIRLMKTRGSTNINLALKTGIEYLSSQKIIDENAKTRSPVLVFLTDGEATAGVTNTDTILKNIKKSKITSEIDIPIFTLAFGTGADYNLVKKVAIQNGGFGKRIYEASDAALQISGFYGEISMTLLKNLSFEYLDAPVSNLTKHHFDTYFDGTECIVAGKLEDFNDTSDDWFGPKMQVTTISAEGPRVLVVTDNIIPDMQGDNGLLKQGDYEKITEKVWAYLTIKQLLDKELATSDETEKLGYKKQILDLSLMYKFVTPLTSMVVTKNKDSEEATYFDTDGPLVLSDVETQDIMPKSIDAAFVRTQARQSYIPLSYSPTKFSAPVPPPSRRVPFRDYFMYDEDLIDPAVQQHTPVLTHSPVISNQKGTSKRRGRPMKNKKSRRNKGKGHTVPLQVVLSEFSQRTPVCFNLFTKQLNDGDEYLLYKDGNIQLVIEMAKRTVGKKSKLSGIKTLTVSHLNRNDTITSQTEQLEMPIEAFRIRTASTDDFITVYIDAVVRDKVENQGILGSILSKTVSLVNNGKGGSSKKITSWLQIGKKSVKAILTKVPKIEGKIQRDQETCWRVSKENVMFKLKKYRYTT